MASASSPASAMWHNRQKYHTQGLRKWQESMVTQLMQLFDLSENQIWESLPPMVEPMSDTGWRGARTDNAESWKCIKGYFRTGQEIKSFMVLLGPQR